MSDMKKRKKLNWFKNAIFPVNPSPVIPVCAKFVIKANLHHYAEQTNNGSRDPDT
jgi:hypothetical protein